MSMFQSIGLTWVILFGFSIAVSAQGSLTQQLFLSSVPVGESSIENRQNTFNEADGVGVDPQGNLIFGGRFSGTRDIAGTEMTARGSQDAFLVKVNPQGVTQWIYQISSNSDKGVENIFDLIVDSEGNTYINGSFTHNLTLGSFTISSAGLADQFLAKVSPRGKFLWVKRLGGSLEDGGNEVALFDDRHLMVSAMSNGTYSVDEDGVVKKYASQDRDGYILKVRTSNGQVVLSKQFTGPGDQQIRAVAAHPSGQMVVGFEFDGTIKFDGASVTAQPDGLNYGKSSKDGIFFVLDAKGNRKWHRIVSSTGFDNVRAAEMDVSGAVYVSGVHGNNAQVGALKVVADRSSDQFIAKYTNAGMVIWYRRLGGGSSTAMQPGGEMMLSPQRTIYVTGVYHGPLVLKDEKAQVIRNIFSIRHTYDYGALLVFNSEGQLVDQSSIVGTSGDVAGCVISVREVQNVDHIGLGVRSHAGGTLTSSASSSALSISAESREFGINLLKRRSDVALSRFEDVGGLGQTYYNLAGSKGLVLCFHGNASDNSIWGGAAAWTSGERKVMVDELSRAGYQFVCPSALNMQTKQWNAKNDAENADVQNVDAILDYIGVSQNTPVFLIGHSNGGGFTSRYVAFSSRSEAIAAVQLSNSSGLGGIMQDSVYQVPTLFAYAQCDAVVDFREVEANLKLLSNKGVETLGLKLDHTYLNYTGSTKSTQCHEFVSTHKETLNFFALP